MQTYNDKLLEIAQRGKQYQIEELARKNNRAQTRYNNKHEQSKQVLTYFKQLVKVCNSTELDTVDLKRLDNYRRELKAWITDNGQNINHQLFDMIDNLNMWHHFSRTELETLLDYTFATNSAMLYSYAKKGEEEYCRQLRKVVQYQLHLTYNDTSNETAFDIISGIVEDKQYTDLRDITNTDIYRQCKRLQRQRQHNARQYADTLKPTSQMIAHIQGTYSIETYVYDNMLFENGETLALTRERLATLETKARETFEDNQLDLNELIQYIVKCPNKQLKNDLAKALRSLNANQNQSIPPHIIQLIRRLVNGLDY